MHKKYFKCLILHYKPASQQFATEKFTSLYIAYQRKSKYSVELVVTKEYIFKYSTKTHNYSFEP